MVTYRFVGPFNEDYSDLVSYEGDNSEKLVCKTGDSLHIELKMYKVLKRVPGIAESVEEGVFINNKGEVVISGKDCLFIKRYDSDLVWPISNKWKSGPMRCPFYVPFTLNNILHHMVRLLTTLEIIHLSLIHI